MPQNPLENLLHDLKALARADKAEFLPRFFKTGPGEYGEGDMFWGVMVPDQRKVARSYWKELNLSDVEKLLSSKVHEQRLTALFILDFLYARSKSISKDQIVAFYLDHLDWVNNWDLVDSSAGVILGNHLLTRPDRSILYTLANSGHLWRERAAIIATSEFIKAGQFHDTLAIAEILLHHKHDLIHKAIGWMLRTLGDYDKKVLNEFLEKHAYHMPRTMLRYSLEHYPEAERKKWMQAAANLKLH